MLNSKQERELAYVVIIDDVTPIDGYDRVELAHVGGWTVVVGKNEFKKFDPAIYFEIDSKLPEVEPFSSMEFLKSKHYKVKTQKMCKSISQGLLMSANNFGWTINEHVNGIIDTNGVSHNVDDESRFLTKQLDVTYYILEDNFRKSSSVDKYKKMAQRYSKIFSNPIIRKIYKTFIGKKLLYLIFGRKIKNTVWPYWVTKTDEERVQNMPWIIGQKGPWIATEKIDGTSTTFTMMRGKKPFGKNKFYICSRNVVFDKPDKNCFYDTNVYVEMSERYDMENVLERILNDLDVEWVTIQGETYGNKIQNRDYNMSIHDFRAFNLITPTGRWGSVSAKEFLKHYGVPFVPIIDTEYYLPDTVDELIRQADGRSVIDGFEREGIVFRSPDGKQSFKAVGNDFLIKYHGKD